MNQEFAVEPEACDTPGELVPLLRQFGLFGGRYIACFPEEWEALALKHVESWPDGLEKQSAKRQLELAKQECAFVESGGRAYSRKKDWIVNVDVVQASSNPFAHVVVHPKHGRYSTPATFDFRYDLTPEIPATAHAIVDISRPLLDASPELALIDPLFNPCERDKRVVLHEILVYLAERSCQRVDIWIYQGPRPRNSLEEMLQALKEVGEATRFAPRPMRLFLAGSKRLGPKKESFRFHRRYMLSIRSALDFDQGFIALPHGDLVPFTIVAKNMHDKLCRRFLEDKDRCDYLVDGPYST